MGEAAVSVAGVTDDLRPRWIGAGAGAFVSTLVLAIPAFTLVVALAPQGTGDTLLSRLSVGASVVGFTILATAGSLLLHREPRDAMGWLLTGAGLAQLTSTLMLGFVPFALSSGTPPPAPVLWATNWLWVPAHVTVLLVLLRFPDGRLAGRGWRIVEGIVLVWGVAAAMTTALAPGPLGATSLDHIDNPFGWQRLSSIIDPLLSGEFMVLPLLNVVAASALVWRWRRADASQRQRLRWVAAAAVVAIVAAPLVLLGTDSAEAPLAVALLLLPAAIAIAVLRRRLWELGVVARTAMTAGLTAVILVAGYAASLRWLPGGIWPALAGLVVAVLAFPLHRLVREVLDRFLLGTDGDPSAIAEHVRSQARAHPDRILQEAATGLARTLRLPWVVFEGRDGTPFASAGVEPPGDGRTTTAVPLLVGGVPVGRLLAAERTPGEGLSPRDLSVLSDVAVPSALLVRSVQTDRTLVEARDRLVAIRAEERARVQRDLHDGLGPVLGGIGLRTEAARNLVQARAEPDRVTAQLDAIGREAEHAVAEVRRLIKELRPTPLEEAGLADALASVLPEIAGDLACEVDLDLAGHLDSRTEVAAYRIAVEAVRNAARHANATRVTIEARIEEDRVLLTVTDDGCGLGGSVPGVGIRAMTERAVELGGSLSMGSPAGGGCQVRAELPTAPADEPGAST